MQYATLANSDNISFLTKENIILELKRDDNYEMITGNKNVIWEYEHIFGVSSMYKNSDYWIVQDFDKDNKLIAYSFLEGRKTYNDDVYRLRFTYKDSNEELNRNDFSELHITIKLDYENVEFNPLSFGDKGWYSTPFISEESSPTINTDEFRNMLIEIEKLIIP